NFLYFLKNSEKYKHHKIYVLENFISRDLAEHWDAAVAERFIWYSDGNFLKWELVKLLFELQQLRVESIIYSNYSRKFTVDWLIGKVRARDKIAVDGDCINEVAAVKFRGNRYYSELITVDPRPIHEFERNKQIFEIVTGEKSSLARPIIEKHQSNLTPNNSVVIFPGAGHSRKVWASENFNKLCQRIITELKAPIILAAAKDGSSQIAEIRRGIPPEQLSCRTGLDLIGLCELIGGAGLLVAGDTAAIHVATLLGIPAICIANGELYSRFIPYPKQIPNTITCIFPSNYTEDAGNYDRWSPFSIDEVRVDDVFHAVAKMMARPIEKAIDPA
ncbi:MAG TPA: glycosyltransferase family 9 protein, partial [Mucilaginibacter sp.]|nr:glycosyltransferase family 9 protein [Mucilaginibacter sp.]